MVPVAHGNDGGGSMRIPAACCGLVGLKAQRDRISTAPELGDSLLVIDGVLTRTVADTAAILDVLAGYEVGDAAWAAAARGAVRRGRRARGPAGCGSPSRRCRRSPTPSSTRSAPRPSTEAAGLAASLGHDVEEVDPPWQVEGLTELFGDVFGAHVGLSIAFSAMIAGREPDSARTWSR